LIDVDQRTPPAKQRPVCAEPEPEPEGMTVGSFAPHQSPLAGQLAAPGVELEPSEGEMAPVLCN